MRRSEVGLALCLAIVLGVVAGLLLFTQAGPFPLLSPGKTGSSPSTRSSPSPSPSNGGSATPSPERSTPSNAAFTKLALLQPENFDKHNWKDTEVLDSWEGPPPEQITSCTDLRSSDGKILAAYAGTYSGRVTTAAEIVLRFPSEKDAQAGMKKLARRITKCQDQPAGESALSAEPISAPQADSSVEVQIWKTSGKDDQALGVVGLARAGDRLAFLTLRSPKPGSTEIVDPRETTYIDALYVYAGRRLI